ncbi:heme A synthase [mine drainage metagenome]|uniref:Heme A synthase n=1 Tax=mine drainage metagenome TaxID=410659 RepID=A0A1J5QI55_9ZZZZ
MHRLFAYLVIAMTGSLVWSLWRIRALRVPIECVMALVLMQVITGVSTVLLGWPLVAAVLHTGGAATLVGVLVWILCASRTAAKDSKS